MANMTSQSESGETSAGQIEFPRLGEYLVVADVRVLEYLETDQNILQQPPYEWLLMDEQIIPADFFEHSEKAEGAFLRTMSRIAFEDDPYLEQQDLETAQQLSKYVNRSYSTMMIYNRLRQAKAYLEQFPYSAQYLEEFKGRFYLDGRPRPVVSTHDRIKTYAAYADACL